MLEWSLPQVSVMRWHPHFLHRLWDESEKAGPLRERLCAAIRKGWEKFEWHLFPIFAPPAEEAGLGHWTLLALRSCAEPLEIFYFDGLHEPNACCMQRAQLVMSILGIDEALSVTNKWRQKGDECAIALLHNSEQVMRYAGGEGWGATRGATDERFKGIREFLGKWLRQLEKARLKWRDESNKEELDIKKLHAAMQQRLGIKQDAETKLKQLKEIMGAKAVAEYLEGSGLPDIEPPEGFGEDQSKGKGKGKGKGKDKSKGKDMGEVEVSSVLEPPAPAVLEQIPEPIEKAPLPPPDEMPPDVPIEASIGLVKGEKGFEAWLTSLSKEELQHRIAALSISNDLRVQISGYLEWVAHHETIEVCGKCRYAGCEKCSVIKSLRYVVRWSKPAWWWKRINGRCLREGPLRNASSVLIGLALGDFSKKKYIYPWGPWGPWGYKCSSTTLLVYAS